MSRRCVFGCCVAFVATAGFAVLAQPAPDSESAREVARLQKAVKGAKQGTDLVAKRLGPLESGIKKLEDRLKDIDPPKLKAEAVEKIEIMTEEPPRQDGGPVPAAPKEKDIKTNEEWRLPLVREVDRKTNIIVVCRENKVLYADLEALFKAVDADNAKKALANGTYSIASGDFDAKFAIPFLELKPKGDRKGETAEQAATPGSALLRRYGKLPPKDNIVQFFVYPDSYPAFQEMRRLTYKLEYAVGWQPVSVGEKLELSFGKASGQ